MGALKNKAITNKLDELACFFCSISDQQRMRGTQRRPIPSESQSQQSRLSQSQYEQSQDEQSQQSQDEQSQDEQSQYEQSQDEQSRQSQYEQAGRRKQSKKPGQLPPLYQASIIPPTNATQLKPETPFNVQRRCWPSTPAEYLVPQDPVSGVRVAPSTRGPKGSRGLFATKQLAKGHIVAILRGSWVTLKDFDMRANIDTAHEFDGILIGNRYLVDKRLWSDNARPGDDNARPGDWWRINHSLTNTNVELKEGRNAHKNEVLFVTTRPVQSGEELCYCYIRGGTPEGFQD